jgi:DNA primase
MKKYSAHRDSKTDQEIAELKRSMPVVDLLAHFGQSIDKDGKLLCFKHTETVGSMGVYKEFFLKCFGCGAFLSLTDVVMHFKGIDFVSACNYLSDLTGRPRIRWKGGQETVFRRIAEKTQTMSEVFAHAQTRQKHSIKYLVEERGLSRDIAERFSGFLALKLRKDTPEHKRLERDGLLSKKGYFLFNGRCVIPITLHGEIVGLYGRAISKNAQVKHIYAASGDQHMPEALWNYDDAKEYETVYLVESIICALTMIDKGIPNVMALFGTQGLTPGRLRLLLRAKKVKKIILVFDNDRSGAGQKAALGVGEKLFKTRLQVEIMTIPRPDGVDKMDPNSHYLNGGTNAELLASPRQEYILARLAEIPQNLSPQDEHDALLPILKLISHKPERIQKSYATTIADRFPSFSEKDVLSECKAIRKGDEPVPLDFASMLQDELSIIYVNNNYLGYSGGFYSPIHENRLGKILIPILGREKASQAMISGVLFLLRQIAFIDNTELNPMDKLNLKNGVLDLTSGGFSPHTPSIYFDYKTASRLDIKAQCPLFLKTLKEIMPDEGMRRLIRQMFGYCLIPGNRFQLAFLLYGGGANGKSLLMDILCAVLGHANALSRDCTPNCAPKARNRIGPCGFLRNCCGMPTAYSGHFVSSRANLWITVGYVRWLSRSRL